MIQSTRSMEPIREGTYSASSQNGQARESDWLKTIQVRRLDSIEEFRQCEQLQARVWGPEDVVRVPTLVMAMAQLNGGFTFGAFAGEQIVGFVFTNPGLTESGDVKQCSILMAIDPTCQSCGLGYRLKLAQREVALAQGVDLITWTFDPLASLNARLNLQKLGCISRRYLVDIYGTVEHGLNGGLPTDRLLVEWWLRKPAVLRRLSRLPSEPPAMEPIINEVVSDAKTGLPVLRGADLERSEPTLLLEIPENISAMKLKDLELARDWRYGLRRIFLHYFARGYQTAAFHRLPCGGRVRPCFVLERSAGGSPWLSGGLRD